MLRPRVLGLANADTGDEVWIEILTDDDYEEPGPLPTQQRTTDAWKAAVDRLVQQGEAQWRNFTGGPAAPAPGPAAPAGAPLDLMATLRKHKIAIYLGAGALVALAVMKK